ncbi:formiminoglutamase [Homoserinimonas aerilata]|uniref:Formiminoglutamase n=1 Tax=Homoserinimonas aerilata TaxID=1162970 RepID=A0A542YI04_9MICO|nr:arginase family protein [Homoserinimonas aerilata]TQL47730.1 formiminoglutamase [Homoserinimonas aerilata]
MALSADPLSAGPLSSGLLSSDPLWPRAGGWPAPEGEAVDLGLIGIPTWRTSLSPTNAGLTPAAVRAALRYYSEHFGGAPDAPFTVADWGDVIDPDADERAAIASVAAVRARLLVALGGDNAATVPAALGTWGARIGTAGLVTVDAHHDLRDGVSNGSPVRRLIEAGLDGSRVVQIGISDFANSAEYARRAKDFGVTVVHRDELHGRSMADVMTEALEVAGSAGGPIHVDLDVDACDRAVAPACPAAVPGGISAHELRVAAREAARHPLVESVDLTEVDASADAPDGRTVRLVALCVLEAAAGLRLREG